MTDPLTFLSALRNAHPDFEHIFQNGCCYELYRIMRTIWPQAQALYDGDHIYVEIDGEFYDTRGRHENPPDNLAPVDLEKCPWYWKESAPRLRGNREALERVAAAGNEIGASVADIAAERTRQIDEEGWTPEHDDEHDAGEIAGAGAAYALNAACLLSPYHGTPLDEPPDSWVWERAWWKPNMGDDPRRDLVKAGALIAAEIDRLERAQERDDQTEASQ